MSPEELDGAFILLVVFVLLTCLTVVNIINPGARTKSGSAAGCAAWGLFLFLMICIFAAAAGIETVPLGPVEVRPVPAQRHR